MGRIRPILKNDMNFSEKVYSLQNAVQHLELPLVIKSNNEYSKEGSSDPDYEVCLRLAPESINLVERKLAVEFADVTVMSFGDLNEAEKEKGIHFTMNHSEYEDESYLLPLTYTGKCKLVPPCGKSKRYVDVTQLMEDLPRLVCVNNSLTLMDLDSMKSQIVPQGTTLEIIRMRTVASNKARSLVCLSPDNKKLILKEGMLVDVTAIEDDTLYTLGKLRDMNVLLPKYVELQEVTPYDIVNSDGESANCLLVIAGGPLRINSFVRREFISCWCPALNSTGPRITFNLALIPKQKWQSEKIKVRKFDGDNEKRRYIQKHFPGSKDAIFMKYKLYLLVRKDEPDIVYLQDREKEAKPQKKDGTARSAPVTLERDAFPDSDVEDYEKVQARIPPPIPPKGRLKSTESTEQSKTEVEKPAKQWQELKAWIAGIKSKLGFDKVHIEIKQGDIMKKLSQKTGFHRGPGSPPKPNQKPRAGLKHSVSVETPVPSKVTLKRSQSSALDATTVSSLATQDSRNHSDSKDHPRSATIGPSILNRPRLPIPKSFTIDDPFSSFSNYNYIDLQDSDVVCRELEKVLKEGQTAEDFYNYSVEQVAYCFNKIALPEVAKLCEKERLDGGFFKDLSEEDIKEHFKVEAFHFIKVKKAIFHGWRPK